MLADEAVLVAAKVGGAAALGSAISLRFIPGNLWQRSFSFVSGIGLGIILGGAAADRFKLTPGGYEHLAIACVVAIFGLQVIAHAMQQLPEWITAARKLIVRS